MSEPEPLILLPGMGADARMFTSLRGRLPEIVTPKWIKPLPRETLVEYARRFAQVIDPGRPFFLGGASLGGVMAAGSGCGASQCPCVFCDWQHPISQFQAMARHDAASHHTARWPPAKSFAASRPVDWPLVAASNSRAS